MSFHVIMVFKYWVGEKEEQKKKARANYVWTCLKVRQDRLTLRIEKRKKKRNEKVALLKKIKK